MNEIDLGVRRIWMDEKRGPWLEKGWEPLLYAVIFGLKIIDM